MAELQIVKIDPDGKETILEITDVPDDLEWCYSPPSPERIAKLEEHYKRTGKPKRTYLDAIYITRRQTERE